MVGAGIFEVPPLVAQGAGSAGELVGMWAMGGAFCLAGSLCYARLAAALPAEGGDYVFIREAFGREWAGAFAWLHSLVIGPGSLASLAFVFAEYANRILEAVLSRSLQAGGTCLLSAVLVCAISWLHARGIDAGRRAQLLFMAAKFLGLALFMTACLGAAPQFAGAPAAPVQPGAFNLACILILYTYGGWSDVAFVGGEVRNPGVNFRRALVLSCVVVTVLYCTLTILLLGALGLTGLRESRSIAFQVFASSSGPAAAAAVAAIVCLFVAGAMSSLAFSGARVISALAAETGRVAFLARRSAGGSPGRAITLQAMLAVLLVVLGRSFSGTLLYTTPLVWSFALITAAAALILPFRTPRLFPRPGVGLWIVAPLVYGAGAAYLLWSSASYNVSGALFCAALAGIYLVARPRLGGERVKR